MGSLIAGMQTLTCDMWDLSHDQGSHPGPLHWELRVLATGPPGKPSCDLLWRSALERCNEGESKAYSGPYFSLTGGILITGSG